MAVDIPPAAALAGDVEFTRHTLAYGELVTVTEAARRLARPTSTLRRWMGEGRFRAYEGRGDTAIVGWGDVVEAEFATRQRKPRISGYLTTPSSE